jgi:hypothetical protein
VKTRSTRRLARLTLVSVSLALAQFGLCAQPIHAPERVQPVRGQVTDAPAEPKLVTRRQPCPSALPFSPVPA